MRRDLVIALCSLAAFGVSQVARAGGTDASFALSARAPAEVSGLPGETVSVEAVVSLATTGLDAAQPGAQGWSLSLAARGWSIADLTVEGTAADEAPVGLRDTGFDFSELTTGAGVGSDCAGRNGAVSAVVLSFVRAVTLPTNAPSDILRVTLEGVVPSESAGCTSCELEFVNGCQGSGQPVDNKVTLNGETHRPSLSSATTRVCPIVRCDVPGKVNLTMSASSIVGEQHQNASTAVSEDVLDLSVVANAGEVGEATVFANIVSNALPSGVQGWSLSASVTGGLVPRDVSVAGTAAADAPDGLRSTGFTVAEAVDPDRLHADTGEPQGPGVVAANVLSFVMPITLAPTGTATVLGITVVTAGPMPEDGTVGGSILWRDRLTGSGQPVSNAATVMGTTNRFCSCQEARVTFVPVTEIPFKRCDPNTDGETNLADAVWIVNELFRAGQQTTCDDAADCNNDGAVDLSDTTYAVTYLFLLGASPPAPFSICGLDSAVDATEDAIGCDEYSFCGP